MCHLASIRPHHVAVPCAIVDTPDVLQPPEWETGLTEVHIIVALVMDVNLVFKSWIMSSLL